MVRGMGWETGMYGIKREEERGRLASFQYLTAVKFSDGTKGRLLTAHTPTKEEIEGKFKTKDPFSFSTATNTPENMKKLEKWFFK